MNDEQSQQQVALSGLQKKRQGKKLTREESAAVKRFLKEKEEKERWDYYGSVPQKHLVRMSGRQPKVLKDFQARYELPCGEKLVDLKTLLRGLFDFVAKHAAKDRKEDDAAVLDGPPTEALEELRRWKARREEFAYKRELGQYRAVEENQQALTAMSNILRQAIETLQRQCGEEARLIMAEAIAEVEKVFGQMGSGDDFDGATSDDDVGRLDEGD